jgi:hypothetical protein
MDDRKLCARCNTKPRAVNYKKDDKIYYRSLCDSCLIIHIKKKKPRWQVEGYRKKITCEECSFEPKFQEQLVVLDQNKKFRTLCLNCDMHEKLKSKIESKKLIIKPDY